MGHQRGQIVTVQWPLKSILNNNKKGRKNYLGDHVNPANYNGALNLDDGAQGFKLLRYLHTNTVQKSC
jgi:hypothetical protein